MSLLVMVSKMISSRISTLLKFEDEEKEQPNGRCLQHGASVGEEQHQEVHHHQSRVPTETDNSQGFLDTILQLDHQLTLAMIYCARPKNKTQRVMKKICQVLEWSGHGVFWFVLCGIYLAYYYASRNADIFFYNYGLNMTALLIIDILVVAPIKLLVKRPRPKLNIGAIPMSVSSVDQYAFPSGHTSRCVALAAYFCYMPPFNPWTHLWYIWGLLVALSRVSLGRHHILDVCAGILAGLVIFEIVRQSGMLLGVGV